MSAAIRRREYTPDHERRYSPGCECTPEHERRYLIGRECTVLFLHTLCGHTNAFSGEPCYGIFTFTQPAIHADACRAE